MFKNSIIKKHNGLSLLELLLLLPITFFIMSSTISIYLFMQKTCILQAALATMQQNALTAIKVLNSDLRISGYIGCAKLTNDFPLSYIDSYELSPNNKIIISENMVTVRHANLSHVNLLKDMDDKFTLITSSEINFEKSDILIISDCKSANIFRVKNCVQKGESQIIFAENPLNFHYDKFAEISKLAINTYFVGKSQDKTKSGAPVYALFLKDIQGNVTELVTGIDNLKIHLDQKALGITFQFNATAPPFFKKTWSSYINFRE